MNWSTEEALEGVVLKPVGKLTSVDTRDAKQATAQEGIVLMSHALYSDCSQISFASVPSFIDRVLLQYIYHAISLFTYSTLLLAPSKRTFVRAPLVAHIVRSLVDIHARWLYVLDQKDPENALREVLVDSIEKAILAMKAAESVGHHSVAKDIKQLADDKQALQANRYRLNTVGVLESHHEQETLTAYRWESGHVHTGFATIAAHGQTLTAGGLTMDVGLSPLSLWRVGQLTWASYGIGLRTVTALGCRIGLRLPEVRKLDAHIRPQVKAAATRARDSDEPISPPYGDFEFPLWSLPVETST